MSGEVQNMGVQLSVQQFDRSQETLYTKEGEDMYTHHMSRCGKYALNIELSLFCCGSFIGQADYLALKTSQA